MIYVGLCAVRPLGSHMITKWINKSKKYSRNSFTGDTDMLILLNLNFYTEVEISKYLRKNRFSSFPSNCWIFPPKKETVSSNVAVIKLYFCYCFIQCKYFLFPGNVSVLILLILNYCTSYQNSKVFSVTPCGNANRKDALLWRD